MDIPADEISRIIKEKISGASASMDLSEVGTVLSVGDGIARAYGLGKVALGELVEFSTGTTPNSAVPASTERNTSSIEMHGSSLMA